MKSTKKKITLPDVPLLAATSVDIDQTQISLKISSQNIKFGEVLKIAKSIQACIIPFNPPSAS